MIELMNFFGKGIIVSLIMLLFFYGFGFLVMVSINTYFQNMTKLRMLEFDLVQKERESNNTNFN